MDKKITFIKSPTTYQFCPGEPVRILCNYNYIEVDSKRYKYVPRCYSDFVFFELLDQFNNVTGEYYKLYIGYLDFLALCNCQWDPEKAAKEPDKKEEYLCFERVPNEIVFPKPKEIECCLIS
jgi:hypothetical protein